MHFERLQEVIVIHYWVYAYDASLTKFKQVLTSFHSFRTIRARDFNFLERIKEFIIRLTFTIKQV